MKDKKTLITIIILLIIFLPMSIYGTMIKIQNRNVVVDDNPNKELVYKDKLYFYDNGVLLGKRNCKGECGKAVSEINDTTYGINYYRLGKEEIPTLLSNNYTLFKENDMTVLYNIDTEMDVLSFDTIKTYNVEQTNPIIIIKVNGKYGVISLETMMPIISYQYDFIAIPNRAQNGILDTSKFIAKNGFYWYLLDSNGNYDHEPYREPIVDFNSKYVVVKNQSEYKIYDSEKNEHLSEIAKKGVYCLGEYILILTETNNLMVYEDLNNPALKILTLTTYNTIDFDYKVTKIDIYIDDNFNQSIDLG